ncbi:hypothetical protein NQ317_013188 [Molorchus minor]|uniref:Uncharacterized protein n=1 Tax=Molorchus minor TaxID=1323400 RepID=A0ABQ9J2N5_9CUCU|nr:hypothetical protein NQ317_013188 [Molorchus minor]
MCRRRLSVIIYFFRRRGSYWVFLASLKDHAGPFRNFRYANPARGGRIKFTMTVSRLGVYNTRTSKLYRLYFRCALCRLCLGQWSAAELRLSAEHGYLRFFTFAGLAMAIEVFLAAPKFTVGPFRSSGYANFTCNVRTKFAISISSLVPVPPMLRGFMPQKYPITPIRASVEVSKIAKKNRRRRPFKQIRRRTLP